MVLDDEKQKLALQAGKQMAQRALDSLTMTEEEKAQQAKEDADKRKMLLVKVILGVTAVIVVGITVMSLVATMWPYLVALIAVAGVSGAGYLVLKPKVQARLQAWNEKRTEGDRLKAAEQAARDQVAAAEKHKQLVAQQKLDAHKKLDDDLARLKKQL